MPFLFNGRRPSSSGSSKDGIKEQLRHIASKGPSSTSVKSGSVKSAKSEGLSTMDSLKRQSQKLLSERRPSHGSKSPKIEPRKSAKIDMKIESPPLVSATEHIRLS
jgi:hypothetical protein